MTWLVPQLTARVQILKPMQTPNADGGFDFGFGQPMSGAFQYGQFDQLSPLMTTWMGLKPVGYKGTGIKYIRGRQVNEVVTHEFTVRTDEVILLGREFSLAFSDAFKNVADLIPLKGDYFLQVEKDTNRRGRLFRIDSVINVEESDEYLLIAAEEYEERGTGYPL